MKKKLHISSTLSLLEKIFYRKMMVVLDRMRQKIFGHSSNCGSESRSDGTGVEYTRTDRVVFSFGGIFSIGFQPKELFGHLHVSPNFKRQSRGEHVQLCKHRNSTVFGCVFYNMNSTCKVHWNILQGLNNTPRNWDTFTLRYRIFFHNGIFM